MAPFGRLALITLHINDLTRSVAFYRDTLGLPVKVHMPEAGWVEFDVSGISLGLHADPEHTEPGSRPPGGPSGFYFVVPSVDASVKELRAKGVAIEDEPADKPYGRDATIADPDGNVLALVTFS